jgi:hypothetical protein
VRNLLSPANSRFAFATVLSLSFDSSAISAFKLGDLCALGFQRDFLGELVVKLRDLSG